MIDVRFVPIEKWPGKDRPSTGNRNAPFRAKYAATLDLLESELNELHAKDITIQAFFARQEIRNDGWPYSSAKPRYPGVIVGFRRHFRQWNSKTSSYREWKEEMSFPCDTFCSWEDNIRAIALALEALRKIDRYGVTQAGEQYKGWARLPEAAPAEEMTREMAAIYIAGYSAVPKDYILAGTTQLNDAYRKAAGILHPDNQQTGNHEAFVRLQKAKQILEAKV
jgi:hypothetical protein